MSTKHTPTPWLLTWSDNGIACFNDGEGLHFLNVRNVRGDDQAIQTEDAALIVRAVNSHGELLGLMREYLSAFDHVDRTDYTGRGTEQLMRNFREIFAAAIAKAEGNS